MSQILKMEKRDLSILEPLLQVSYGFGFDIQDELDYFSSMPHHSWFYLSQDDIARGFIRCFEIEESLYQIELFVTPSETYTKNCQCLIEYFLKNNQLGKTRVRFEVEESKVQLLELLDKCFAVRNIKRFLYMGKFLQVQTAKEKCKLTEHFFEKIANILSALKTYTPEHLNALYQQQKLYVFCDPEPVAALHIEDKSNKVCEIITLATDITKLRRGYAEKLLQNFFAWASSRFNKVELKVNESNVPAVKLYQKMGFASVKERTQQWWYVDVK